MAIKPIKERNLTTLQKKYQAFWTRFNAVSYQNDEFSNYFKVHPIASIRSYQDYSIGCGYHIAIKLNFRTSKIYIGAYFDDVLLYQDYYNLYRKRIEKELGTELKWDEQTTKGSAYWIMSQKLDTSEDWDRAIKVMIHSAILIKLIFGQYLEK